MLIENSKQADTDDKGPSFSRQEPNYSVYGGTDQ
jgi:hypothetical protein